VVIGSVGATMISVFGLPLFGVPTKGYKPPGRDSREADQNQGMCKRRESARISACTCFACRGGDT
jgi:hypothetical protein